MENKQLDFNAPLISVRRFSSPSHSSELVKRKMTERPLPARQQSLPVSNFKWEYDEVTKPASVPFHWEHIPGKPKEDIESRAQSPRRSSSTPRLPPARVSDALRRNSGETNKLVPGRSSTPSRYTSGDQNIYRPQVEAFPFSDHASLLEKLNESLNCNDSDSESEDDVHSDALDMLSPTDWSMNCSVSGVSGCQSLNMKSSGTFSIDTQTRDYMMDRFLPAAKAVVLETPQYVTKKPAAVNIEQPKQIRKVVSEEQKLSFRPHRSQTMPYYSQHIPNVESDGEDQERTHVPVKKSRKTWGILPRFCVKNTLCMLKPIPGMKLKPHNPTPSSDRAQRFTRNAHSGPIDKSSCHVPQKKKYHSGLLTRDLEGIESKPSIDMYHFLNSRESYRSEVSPLRRYRSGNISPFRNESPRSHSREAPGFLGVPKQVENYNPNNQIASSRKLFKALQDVSRTPISNRRSDNNNGETVENDFLQKVVLPVPKPSPTEKDGHGHVEESEDNVRESDLPAFKMPLPPPLPKSPTESWLWRTLPSIPLGNPFSASRRRSHFHRKEGQRNSSADAKWETIVKTSKIRDDHVRYSEELGACGSH